LTVDKFSCQRRQSIILTLGPAVFDRHIPALDEAGFAQTLAERGHHRGVSARRFAVEPSDHRHRRLLRLRRKRPRGRRAAEQRYELAPFHSITSSAISRRRARERSAARLSRARGGDSSVCAMLLLIAAIGTTRMACDEGRQAFTPPRGPFSLHP
jgi:hypothetical protein